MNAHRYSMHNVIRSLMIAAFAIVSAATGPLVAQQVQWEEVGGPTGGEIRRVAQGHHGQLFALTYQRGMFRSTDGGSSWHQPPSIQSEQFVWSFFAAPDGPLLLSGNENVYISQDGGLVWTPVAIPISQQISFAADSTGVLFAAARYDGLFHSTDKGVTWSRPGDSIVREITALAVASDGALLAGIGTGINTFGSPAGLMRSTDRGATFNRLDTFMRLDGIESIATAEGGTILASTEGSGIIRSSDNGAGWSQIDTGTTGSVPGPLYSRGNRVFAASGSRGLIVSTDMGATWASFGDPPGVGVTDVTIRADGAVVITTTGKGVLIGDEAGRSWQRSNAGLLNTVVYDLLATRPQSLLAVANGNSGELYRSTNNGTAWSVVAVSSGQPVSMLAAATTGEVYALVSAATPSASLFRSDDDGITWSSIGAELIGDGIRYIAPGSSGTFYAMRHNGAIERTTDRGVTWTRAFDTAGAGWLHTMVVSNGYLYSVTSFGHVVRIAEGGGAWETRSNGLPGHFVVRVAAASDGTLLAGTALGLMRSTDGGGEWVEVIFTDDSPSITHLVAGPDGVVIAATGTVGVFISRDNGLSWSPANDGLLEQSVHVIAIDSSGRAFVGTNGRGVSRSIGVVSGVSTDLHRPRGGLSAHVVPNPATTTAALHLEISASAEVSFSVVDLLGRPVGVAGENMLTAGRHSIPIDLGSVAPGVYFCRIEVDGVVMSVPVTLLHLNR